MISKGDGDVAARSRVPHEQARAGAERSLPSPLPVSVTHSAVVVLSSEAPEQHPCSRELAPTVLSPRPLAAQHERVRSQHGPCAHHARASAMASQEVTGRCPAFMRHLFGMSIASTVALALSRRGQDTLPRSRNRLTDASAHEPSCRPKPTTTRKVYHLMPATSSVTCRFQRQKIACQPSGTFTHAESYRTARPTGASPRARGERQSWPGSGIGQTGAIERRRLILRSIRYSTVATALRTASRRAPNRSFRATYSPTRGVLGEVPSNTKSEMRSR